MPVDSIKPTRVVAQSWCEGVLQTEPGWENGRWILTHVHDWWWYGESFRWV